MNAQVPFKSRLASVIADYLALKRALGRDYDNERWILQSLDIFLAEQVADAGLTAETFARWCRTLKHLSPTVRRMRMRVVRNLCLSRRRTEPACFVPDAALFPPIRQPAKPHIFSDAEVARLIDAARSLQVAPLLSITSSHLPVGDRAAVYDRPAPG